MKKLLLLAAAGITALLVAEAIVAFGIGYPRYGVKERLNISDFQEFQNIYYPHTKFWNVEGGNRVFSRNNLGFPGIDVQISEESKNILMLGNSVLEALQVEPEDMATSLLHFKLNKEDPDYQVINLACSGQSPYDLWIRMAYYEKLYEPHFLIMVMQNTFTARLEKHPHPLNFDELEDLGMRDERLFIKVQKFFRNHSHFANLLAHGYTSYRGFMRLKKSDQKWQNLESGDEEMVVSQDFLDTIDNFHEKYGTKFVLISIIENGRVNSKLEEYCGHNNIQFGYIPLHTSAHQIGGEGHLNEGGHKILGEFLYETYKKFAQ